MGTKVQHLEIHCVYSCPRRYRSEPMCVKVGASARWHKPLIEDSYRQGLYKPLELYWIWQ